MAGNRRHVPPLPTNLDDLHPLPTPSTSRNLLPRFARSRATSRTSSSAHSRALSRSSSRSSAMAQSRNLSGHNRAMQSTMAGLSRSRPAKRRRTNHAPTRIVESEDWLTSDEEDEVDQLISDNESELPPPSQLVVESGPNSQQTESRSGNSNVSQSAITVTADVEVPSSSTATKSMPVSSPSLAKILHPVNIEQISFPPTTNSPKSLIGISAKPSEPKPNPEPEPKPQPQRKPEPEPEHEPLSAYTCPICFFPPTNATLTPCGHICCGSCLFTAIKTTMQRGALMAEGNVPRCPVCRAEIPKWDGKGGGVIGLKPRAVFSL